MFGSHMLGGPGKVVVVDEVYVVKRKRIGGYGPAGRVTSGHKTCILAAAELDLGTRSLTGRMWMRVIAGPRRECIEPILRATVAQGTPIWSDCHASYDWISSAGYPHVTTREGNEEGC